MKSDAASYYASIDRSVLCDLLRRRGIDRPTVALIRASLDRVVDRGGLYERPARRIPLGSPLSPLLAAVYLGPVDEAVARLGLFYARYLDDWVVVAPTRWKLRRAVAAVNRELVRLRLGQHPGKTFIGRAERGFDFLGFRLSPGRIEVNAGSRERFVERRRRLYERGASAGRIGAYERRWGGWAGGRVG